MGARDVVITGIGLVSSLGEGTDVHWQKLSTPGFQPILDETRFAPYIVHPLPGIDWTPQIPKRGDQRQMENWQRLGTYTAGLALDDAGLKGDEALCSTMDMTIAAAGGERDVLVDQAILDASATRNDRDVLLNEKLMTELRPTLFLAQLSNLLAGNISIVHKVTGSSRTFMGEEGAGISAIETAAARIRAGQSTHALVGGALQTEHPDMLLGYELGGYLHRGPWRPVWSRGGAEGGGVISGSGAAFLVLESREHAEKRGARVYAAIGPVTAARIERADGRFAEGIGELISATGLSEERLLTISGASGAHLATEAEKAALRQAGKLAVRGLSTVTGHLKEAQFPFAIALAALAVRNLAGYPAFDPATEEAFEGIPEAVLTTTIGYHRSHGAALVTAA
jgi:3-oxoacyl-[acyl-carrier-protein] synthase II